MPLLSLGLGTHNLVWNYVLHSFCWMQVSSQCQNKKKVFPLKFQVSNNEREWRLTHWCEISGKRIKFIERLFFIFIQSNAPNVTFKEMTTNYILLWLWVNKRCAIHVSFSNRYTTYTLTCSMVLGAIPLSRTQAEHTKKWQKLSFFSSYKDSAWFFFCLRSNFGWSSMFLVCFVTPKKVFECSELGGVLWC